MNSLKTVVQFEVPSSKVILLRVAAIEATLTFILVFSDGLHSVSFLPTLGLITGPFTFLWWPYFRNEIGVAPLLGLVPLAMIMTGVYFRYVKWARYIAYLGGIAWTIVGFLYVAGHLD